MHFGFIENVVIRDLFDRNREMFADMDAIIVRLDSDDDVRKKFETFFRGPYVTLGNAVRLGSRELTEFFAGPLSNSFDQIMLSRNFKKFESLPQGLLESLTPDCMIFDEHVPPDLDTMLIDSGVEIVLADGIGIGTNIACSQQSVFDVLRA